MDRHRVARILFWFGIGIILGILVNSLVSCGPTPTPAMQPVTPTAVIEQQQVGIVEYGWQHVDGPSGCRSAVQFYISEGRRVYTGGTMVYCGDAPSIAFP